MFTSRRVLWSRDFERTTISFQDRAPLKAKFKLAYFARRSIIKTTVVTNVRLDAIADPFDKLSRINRPQTVGNSRTFTAENVF